MQIPQKIKEKLQKLGWLPNGRNAGAVGSHGKRWLQEQGAELGAGGLRNGFLLISLLFFSPLTTGSTY